MDDRNVTLDRPAAAPAALWWSGLTLMAMGLTAPILAVDVPPLADYPNHLARSFFLAFGARDPVLQSMFATRWDLIPNLAIDLILPPLMQVMPPMWAGKIVVALAALLPTTGAIALSRACFGRLSIWQLCAGFVAYNAMFLIGLLNFELSIGVALWGAAAWIATSSRHPAVALPIGAAFALLAFIFHLFGFCFFALLIGSAELADILRRGLGDRAARRFAIGRIGMTATVVLPPAILSLLSPVASVGGLNIWLSLGAKLYLLLGPVLGYSPPIVSTIAVVALLALLIRWRLHGRLAVAPLAWICGPLLLLIYAALPVGAKGGYWIDARMPVLFGFTLFATTMPQGLGRREAYAVAAALLAIFAARMAFITEIWVESRRDVADVRQTLTPVTAGSRVLMVDVDPYSHQRANGALPASRVPIAGLPAAYWHYAAFALIDRRAFWADAFALYGQQPVMTRAAYQASTGAVSAPFDYAMLDAYAEADTAPDPSSLLAGWPNKFDYILLLNADGAADVETLLPRRLVFLDRKGIAAIFKVKH